MSRPRALPPASPLQAFRADLVQRVALTDEARRVAANGMQPGLAEALGVQPDILQQAAVLARRGFANQGKIAVREKFDVFLRVELYRAMLGMANYHGLTVPTLIRSTLHKVLQMPREPVARSARQWGPLPGCESFRAQMVALAGPLKKSRKVYVHLDVQATRGFMAALQTRAHAYGVRRARYVLLWMATLCDGFLNDIPMVAVEFGQLFDDEGAYVLPVVGPPVVEESSPCAHDPPARTT